ncbi:uncharacterized protein LOC110844388 [Folsomia candida]|uniref:uncharacterized protein LOC110844388 n=1 Tax=Folsomia candida TaxID=158441 RepID=UPI0016052E2B|nr:uncharacterized protein LOC110844388 [Folsomia candida]
MHPNKFISSIIQLHWIKLLAVSCSNLPARYSLQNAYGNSLSLFASPVNTNFKPFNDLIPVLISSQISPSRPERFTKSEKTLGIFLNQISDTKHANQSRFFGTFSGLMASDILQVVLNHTTGNITPVNKRKQRDCLIISNSIFQYFPSGSRLDDYFRRIESIVLDFYSWFKDEMEATLNIKNRHIMLLKVISTHLNLSFSSCGSDQDPDDRDERDIDFAISSYKLQKQKLPKAVLIHSREKYKITFASVKSRDFTAIFVTLVRPVGWRVFACTATCITVLTLLLTMYSKICNFNEITTGKVTFLLIRAHIDQCTTSYEIRQILHRKLMLQFVYVIWLFYCLLIAATYKSNLVQQLQQPTSTVCASTFKELLEDGRPIVGLGGKRPGEYPNLRQIIRTEAEKLANDKEADKANVLLELLKVYEWSEGRKPDHIVKGKFNMLEDEVMLKVIFAIMKNRYAVHHYQIAKDVIVNNEYWAVKYGPRTRRIVEIIGRLVNGGITDHFRYYDIKYCNS